jgi:hypothetical protein
MKIIPNEIQTLSDIEKELGKEVIIRQMSDGCWKCVFSGFVEKKNGIMLGNSNGNSKPSIEESIKDFCKNISETTLVKNSTSPKTRKEIKTKTVIFGKCEYL